MRLRNEVLACALGSVLGVGALWWAGAPLQLWSASGLALFITLFSLNCLAGGPLS